MPSPAVWIGSGPATERTRPPFPAVPYTEVEDLAQVPAGPAEGAHGDGAAAAGGRGGGLPGIYRRGSW